MTETFHTVSRNTKYVTEILQIIREKQHVTNAEIIATLRKSYPQVSATTVHRVSARLAKRGVIGLGPNDRHGSIRYDANPVLHDHFVCSVCDGMRDMDIAKHVVPHIVRALDGCAISGRLVIYGSCQKCLKKE